MRYRKLLSLSLPIVGSMLSQSLMNLVDTALVGRLGEDALAGVGAGSYAIFLATALLLGLASAVQANIAHACGAEDRQQQRAVLSNGMLLGLLMSLLVVGLFWAIKTPLLHWITIHASVQAIAEPYFDWRILGLPAVAMSLVFRGVLNGSHQPGTFLKWLALTHLLNASLSFCLIYGHAGLPEMGASGAGLGTTISLYVGSLAYGLLVVRTLRPSCRLLSLTLLRTMLGYVIPHSAQQLSFALSLTVLFWIIGLLGTAQQAIAHVLMNLSLLLILPGVGLGMACTTLVGHALGRNHPDAAYRWGIDGVKTAFVVLLVLGIPLWLFPSFLLSLFLPQSNLIAAASPLLIITALMLALDAASLVLNQALYGAGAGQMSMTINIISQWCFFLPLAWLFGPILGGGLLAIWLVQFAQRCINSGLYTWIWRQRHWQPQPASLD